MGTENPVRYARVKAEQDRLQAERARSSSITIARLRPYCNHNIEVLSRGTHDCPFINVLITERMLDFRLSLSVEFRQLLK